jgi:hypothetical protein
MWFGYVLIILGCCCAFLGGILFKKDSSWIPLVLSAILAMSFGACLVEGII